MNDQKLERLRVFGLSLIILSTVAIVPVLAQSSSSTDLCKDGYIPEPVGNKVVCKKITSMERSCPSGTYHGLDNQLNSACRDLLTNKVVGYPIQADEYDVKSDSDVDSEADTPPETETQPVKDFVQVEGYLPYVALVIVIIVVIAVLAARKNSKPPQSRHRGSQAASRSDVAESRSAVAMPPQPDTSGILAVQQAKILYVIDTNVLINSVAARSRDGIDPDRIALFLDHRLDKRVLYIPPYVVEEFEGYLKRSDIPVNSFRVDDRNRFIRKYLQYSHEMHHILPSEGLHDKEWISATMPIVDEVQSMYEYISTSTDPDIKRMYDKWKEKKNANRSESESIDITDNKPENVQMDRKILATVIRIRRMGGGQRVEFITFDSDFFSFAPVIEGRFGIDVSDGYLFDF